MKKINQTTLFFLGSILCFFVGKLSFLSNSYAQTNEHEINQELQILLNKNTKKENEPREKQTTIKTQSKSRGTQPTTICLK